VNIPGIINSAVMTVEPTGASASNLEANKDSIIIIKSLITNLSSNTRNAKVKTLQTLLKKEGYFTYPYITNYYGSYTKQAVDKFLKNNK
jgi:peptidoglycan hydrolase-like protein with peptidoglycan-binding domain